MNKSILFYLFSLIALLSLMAGCGEGAIATMQSVPDTSTVPVGETGADGVVVRARASFYIATAEETALNRLNRAVMSFFLQSAYAAVGTQPATVVLAANSSMTMSNAGFVMPAISNELLDFGILSITALKDNDLKHCGSNSNQQCGIALFRIYTTGTGGAGFYNTADGYGAPITAGPAGNLSSIGLNVPGAAIVQSVSIPGNKHVINLSDFSPAPVFGFKADFTNAGAGTYATTLTVEYALAE